MGSLSLAGMLSKLSLWRHWVKAVPMQGGPKADKNRFEVLDRLCRIKAGY
jgi:hypothetical protein